MLRSVSRKMGLAARVRDAVTLPFRHLKQMTIPMGETRPINHSIDKFEEEAAEWHAFILQNAYESNMHQNYETVTLQNFGTVDNPHVIFTNDIPFRFVGCTGASSEDDHDGHEIMYFLLREGPLQRCMVCGQVYKLVRLRQEYSIMNDYYHNSIMKTEWEEVGPFDHVVQMNPLRIMPFTWEHSLFEVPTNRFVTLRNADDHDRMMVDPAYRLEVLTLADHKAQVAEEAFREINDEYIKTYGEPLIPMNKVIYENVVKADIAMAEYDKHLKRMTKFFSRELIDPANHARREARLQERSRKRVADSHTIYLDDFSEEELQYRDYFETDLEVSKELERDPLASKTEALRNPELALNRFVFSELYTHNPEGDMSSLMKRKIFRFKYRQALTDPDTHARRERRMLERAQQRGFPEIEQLSKNLDMMSLANASTIAAAKFKNETTYVMADQALQDYRNYFESDLEEDIELIERLPLIERMDFATAYENPILEKMLAKYPKTHLSIPRARDEHASGMLLGDASEFFKSLDSQVTERIADFQGLSFDARSLEGSDRKPALKGEKSDEPGKQTPEK